MPGRPRIIIVGAGASGLAACCTLRSRSQELDVIVLEKSDRAGGRIAGERVGEFRVDTATAVFDESFETVRNLSRSVGVSLEPSVHTRGGHFVCDGRLWGIYAGGTLRQMLETVRTILSFRLYSPAGIWQSMRFYRMLQARGRDLSFEDHSGMLDLDRDESFAEFAKRHSLGDYLREAGQIDVSCFTASYPEKVGAAFGMALIWLWTFNSATRSCMPEFGVGALSDALIHACGECVRLATPVERIVLEDGKATGVVTGDGAFIGADAVICATPATTALAIAPGLPAGIRRTLGRVAYSSCVNVALGFDTGILPAGSHAVAFPRDAGSILTIRTNSSLMASRVAPEGKALVHAMVIDKDAEALFPLSDAEIGSRIVEEIRRFLPATPEPLFTRAYRWPEALCISPGGARREIHAMRMEGPQGLDRLFLAGDYMRMPLCNGAMASGVDAAERSAAHVSGLQANRPGFVGLGVNEETEALGDPPGSICS